MKRLRNWKLEVRLPCTNCSNERSDLQVLQLSPASLISTLDQLSWTSRRADLMCQLPRHELRRSIGHLIHIMFRSRECEAWLLVQREVTLFSWEAFTRWKRSTTGHYFVRVFETMQDPDPLIRMYSLLMCAHASCWRASILHLSYVNQEMCQLWSWFDLTTQLDLVSNMFVNLRCFTPNSLLLNLFAWFVWMFLLINFGVSNCTSTCWLKGDPPETFAALKQHAKKKWSCVAVPIVHIFLASVGRLYETLQLHSLRPSKG